MPSPRDPSTDSAKAERAQTPERLGGVRRYIGWGIAIAGIGCCVILVASAPTDLLEAFRRIRLGPAILAILFMVATRVVDAWLFVHLFANEDHALGFRHAIRIVTLQNLSAFVAPKSGLVAAAALLKFEHGVGLARFTGVQIASLAIKIVMTASIGLCAAIAVRTGMKGDTSTVMQDAMIVGFASLLPLVGVGYLIASRARISGSGRIATVLFDAWTGMTDLLEGRRRLLWILTLSAITALLKIASFCLVVYGVLGALDAPLGVVVVSTASELGTALSFTPAGLGVREATAGVTAGFADLAPPLMIGIALVDRMLMLLATLVLAPTVLTRRLSPSA